MTSPDSVSRYYGEPDILTTILAAATAADGSLQREVLQRIDEFHVGGSAATDRVLDRMALPDASRLIDIGSGVGGPARRAAARGLTVTGVDLTPGFVDAASELSQRIGASGVTFLRADALSLPFEDHSFEAAMMLHVGMNIADKTGLMAEVARVLVPGGVFAIYDILRLDEAVVEYPQPWALTAETSCVTVARDYSDAAAAAGLEAVAVVDRSPEARNFFTEMQQDMVAREAVGLPPSPGIGLIMGNDAPMKLANLRRAVMEGHLAPCEMHFRKAENIRPNA